MFGIINISSGSFCCDTNGTFYVQKLIMLIFVKNNVMYFAFI